MRRPRFTIRALMVAVAVVAGALGLCDAFGRDSLLAMLVGVAIIYAGSACAFVLLIVLMVYAIQRTINRLE